MENATKTALTNAYEQMFHALNNTSAQFAAHPSIIAISGLPVAAGLRFVPGLMMGLCDRISHFYNAHRYCIFYYRQFLLMILLVDLELMTNSSKISKIDYLAKRNLFTN